MIDPIDAKLVKLPLGGCVDPQAEQLAKIRSQLVEYMEGLSEVGAALEALERLPVVQETQHVFLPVLQARVQAEAAAQVLRILLAGPHQP